MQVYFAGSSLLTSNLLKLYFYNHFIQTVVDQRRQYKLMMQGKPSSLDTDRIQKLEQLDFAWNVRNRPEWNTRYEQLLEYKKKFGDTKVPQHYKDIKGLGKWVSKNIGEEIVARPST